MTRCPQRGTPLRLADQDLLDRANRAVAAGTLTNRMGRVVETSLDGGLVNDDGSLLYPIRGGIPCLIRDEAIELDQLDT